MVDYVLLRRALSVEVIEAAERSVTFELRGDWPVGVISSRLSFRVSGLPATRDCAVTHQPSPLPGGTLRSKVHGCEKRGRDFIVTLDAVPGVKVTVRV